MKENSINKTYHLFFSNLANPLRIEIVSALKQKEGLSVSELASTLWINQSKLSHALANLRKCNLVSVTQKGKKRIYSLNKKTMLPILEIIDNHAKLNCGGNCRFCSKTE
jgi:DNA-binding transcriptional ArsR family regulator